MTAMITTKRDEVREEFREIAREFGEQVVKPRAAELDRKQNPADCMSWEIVEEADKAGLRTMVMDPEYGGAGVDTLCSTIVIEEVAKYDLGVGVILAQNNKFIHMIQKAGTDEQKARFLPAIAGNPRYLIAAGFTEPGHGSNYLIPYDAPDASFETNAVRQDDGWVINGYKQFLSNGNTSELHIVCAQTTPGVSFLRGATMFLVEKGTKGFSVGEPYDKLGERLVNNAPWTLENVFVPDENRVGEVDGAFAVLPRLMGPSNIFAGASILGVGVAAYEKCLEWARERVQGGKPIIEHDTIGIRLAEMRMKLDVARAYLHHCSVLADNPDLGWDPVMTAYPKVAAAEAVWDVVGWAAEMHGGYGYMRWGGGVGMEKLVRDATAFLHSDGVQQTLLLKAAKFIRNSA